MTQFQAMNPGYAQPQIRETQGDHSFQQEQPGQASRLGLDLGFGQSITFANPPDGVLTRASVGRPTFNQREGTWRVPYQTNAVSDNNRTGDVKERVNDKGYVVFLANGEPVENVVTFSDGKQLRKAQRVPFAGSAGPAAGAQMDSGYADPSQGVAPGAGVPQAGGPVADGIALQPIGPGDAMAILAAGQVPTRTKRIIAAGQLPGGPDGQAGPVLIVAKDGFATKSYVSVGGNTQALKLKTADVTQNELGQNIIPVTLGDGSNGTIYLPGRPGEPMRYAGSGSFGPFNPVDPDEWRTTANIRDGLPF